MDALVLGGTRFFGVHLVEALLDGGNAVTIATRGRARDPFAERVTRLTCDRRSRDSLRAALSGRRFDVCYDNLCYCSDDVRALLDVLDAGRYVMTSTASVYTDWRMGMGEAAFDPSALPLTWCRREDHPYDVVKRQAECAVTQAYPDRDSALMRIPFVVGTDDYTQRLYFYVQRIVTGMPVWIDNWDARISCVNAGEAGRFLAWLGTCALRGPVNASSLGTFTLRQVAAYVARRTGRAPVTAEDGAPGPYNGCPSFSLDVSRAEAAGFVFSRVEDWLYGLIDAYLERAQRLLHGGAQSPHGV